MSELVLASTSSQSYSPQQVNVVSTNTSGGFSGLPLSCQQQVWLFLHPFEMCRVSFVNCHWLTQLTFIKLIDPSSMSTTTLSSQACAYTNIASEQPTPDRLQNTNRHIPPTLTSVTTSIIVPTNASFTAAANSDSCMEALSFNASSSTLTSTAASVPSISRPPKRSRKRDRSGELAELLARRRAVGQQRSQQSSHITMIPTNPDSADNSIVPDDDDHDEEEEMYEASDDELKHDQMYDYGTDSDTDFINSSHDNCEEWIAPVQSQVRVFSIPISSSMTHINRDRNRRRVVLKHTTRLLFTLRGLHVLDVTQSNIVPDDKYCPEEDGPREYCIRASQLLHPITLMTRLHTLIWNDDILQYKPPDRHIYATGMSKLPATLTYLDLRVHNLWWHEGVYQPVVTAWPPLTRLELQFERVPSTHSCKPLIHIATFRALMVRHHTSLRKFAFVGGHVYCQEWAMIGRCRDLIDLNLQDTSLHGLAKAIVPNTPQTVNLTMDLPSMSTLVLPRVCSVEQAATESDQTDMYDHALLQLWLGLPMHSQLRTLDAKMLPISPMMIRLLNQHTRAATTSASSASTTGSIGFLGVRSLSLCSTESVELQLLCSLLSALTPALQHLHCDPLVYDDHWLNTKQVLLLHRACPRLQSLRWQPDPAEEADGDFQLSVLMRHMPDVTFSSITHLNVSTYSYTMHQRQRHFKHITIDGFRHLSRFVQITHLVLTTYARAGGFDITSTTTYADPPQLGVCDAKLRFIAQSFPLLTNLTLAAPFITDLGLASLPTLRSLERLMLHSLSSQVTDGSWLSLSQCTRLRMLSLWWKHPNDCKQDPSPTANLTVDGIRSFQAQASETFRRDWIEQARATPHLVIPYPSLVLDISYPYEMLLLSRDERRIMISEVKKQVQQFPITELRFESSQRF